MFDFDTIFQIVDKLRDTAKYAATIDIREDLITIKEQLLNLKAEQLKLITERDSLLAEINHIKDVKTIRHLLVRADMGYMLNQPWNGYQPGLYCTACFDFNNRLVAMTSPNPFHKSAFTCPVCARMAGK